MAERRMFARAIIDSDAFIDMPITARLLYYDLGMRADDDGFVNSPKSIMRAIGASLDDLKILAAKKFIIEFENGIVVIKHWKIHNYIRKDSYSETKYKELKSMLELDENNSYRFAQVCDESVTVPSQPCDDVVADMSTQGREGKDRIVKDNTINNTHIEKSACADRIDYKSIMDSFNEKCGKYLPKVKTLTNKRKTKIKNLLSRVQKEDIIAAFDKVSKSHFLQGGGRTGWVADFDWLMDENNIAKVLEGNFDDRQQRRKEDCINDRSEYGNSDGLYEGFATALDDAKD